MHLFSFLNLFALLNIILFVLIGILHFYWAMGGTWGAEAAIPQADNQEVLFQPGPIATLIVALGLFGFAGVHLMAIGDWAIGFDSYINIALILIAVIFLCRFIGEFNYIGLFKKKRENLFSEKDTKYYTPLSLLIFINTLITFYN